MPFKVGAATDIGRKRSQNQDSIASLPELGLFVVADGMGGHRGGETASAMAVEIIPQALRESLQANLSPQEALAQAIARASNSIFERSEKEPQLQGMGTTTTALFFRGSHAYFGHVGDSRAYFFSDHALWQVTRDHSLVQEKLRAGLISREEVKTDRMKNVITRSVGFELDVKVEIYEMPVKAGDLFLLCSDGLSGLVEDKQILEILLRERQSSNDLQKMVKTLIETANSNGGDDNISTILVEATGS